MSPNSARLLIVIAALMWSLSGTFTKLLVLPGPMMAAWRVLFAGLSLLPLLNRRSIHFSWAMAGMLFCFATMNVTFVTAMTLTTAANAIFLQYTAPLWIVVASVYWLREPFDRRNVIPLALGMVGIAIIVLGGRSEESVGIFLALLAGAAYAGVAVFLRALRDEDAIWLTVVNHLGSGALLLAALAILPGTSIAGQVGLGRWIGLVAFGVVQMAVPYVLFSRGLKTIPATEAGVITLLEPVANPVLTYLAMGEVPAKATVLGGAVILFGVAWRYVIRRY